jgi:hypothetical protein
VFLKEPWLREPGTTIREPELAIGPRFFENVDVRKNVPKRSREYGKNENKHKTQGRAHGDCTPPRPLFGRPLEHQQLVLLPVLLAGGDRLVVLLLFAA